MSDIFKRLLKVAEYYNVTKPSEFAKKTGFSHQTASNYLKNVKNGSNMNESTFFCTNSTIQYMNAKKNKKRR